jgi:disulfide bond formation protein DsbB
VIDALNMYLKVLNMLIRWKDEKVVGYILLVIGLCTMLYSIVTVLSVFNGGDAPLEILHAEESPDTEQEFTGNTTDNTTMPTIDFSEMMIPLFPMFNMLIWITIAFFLVVAGGRVAGIGIKMIKLQPHKEKSDQYKVTNKNKEEKQKEKKAERDGRGE